MRVFTTTGFYSVVIHRTHPGHVLVRARKREDLEALLARIPQLTIVENCLADYPWRVEVKTVDWQNALASLATVRTNCL